MASETFVQPAIPRFDGHYDHWSMLMENFLRSKEYWDVVESGVAEPTARMSEAQKAELEALKLKDLKAKNYLFQAIDRTILETILCKDTSKQIWDSMKKKYQGTTKTKRQQLQALRSEFEILRMKEGETVTDYFSRTMAIVNKLRTHGDKTQDVTVVEKILRSMTPKYNLLSVLLRRGKGRGRGRNQQTQFFEGRGRGRGRFHISYKPKSTDKSKVECFQCHKYGHYQSECRANLPNNEGEKSNFAQIEEEISLLMVCHDGERSNKNLWYLDTGCSNHMCGDKAAFSTLDESFKDNVKFGDNSKVSVRGKGQVTIQIRGKAAQTISNVLYVPELKTNLLKCHLNCASQSCFSAKTNDVAWLWHSRYGHLNFGGLKQLQQKNMVTSLPVFESPSTVCEECVVSKQHHDQFPKGRSTRARRLLEIVYSDICGPINPVSNGDEKRKKLDDKGEKSIFLGVSNNSKAYKLYNPNTKKIIQPIENEQQTLENQSIIPVAPETPATLIPKAESDDGQRPQRVRKRPTWMLDYEVPGIEQSDEEELTYFALFSYCDPVAFRDATKLKENGEVDKYKVRLVTKGYKQEFGVDYQEVFAPVARHDTIRLVISLAAQNSWPVFQLDVKSAFLHGDLDEQAMFDKFKKFMMVEVDMSDLGLMHYYLGIEVDQSATGIFISQKKYVQDILDRFRMKDCNPVSTPIDVGMKLVKNPEGKKVNSTLYKQIVGSLMYLTATRPDIMHVVSLINRYMESPKEMHLLAAKRILGYLKGTVEYGLFYKKGEKSNMFGFTDSDFARDVDDRKSTSGYVFMMGTTAVSWSSRKQLIVTLSTTEAEFVAATSCACQVIWLLRILEECHSKQEEPLIIFCDNNSTIKLSKNPILHGRCKHIDVRNYFLRDLVKEGVIDLVYCRSEDQLADIFTKPLKLSAF
ncbi:hypothetical protein SLEP1_g37906 [Rubroshorea leprosula]|uniref:CCHC-type domain-containing protein n=1 Tax=Rubroshorea leprosula TaxID=152421 RepID=A0AAV5KWE3_9ROSI|nr:hypothetical protein SLEP1_g37906 [Rubroshorea leprosula]